MEIITGEIKRIGFISLFYFKHPAIFLKNLYLNLTSKKIRTRKKITQHPISIIIVTYNALSYVQTCLQSLSKTDYKNKEIIVVDNGSSKETVDYLKKAKTRNLINKLYLSEVNTYFSGGNNIGALISSKKSEYLVLLNSDIEIKNPDWLKVMMANKPDKGILSFGKVDIPVVRPDGWCFMVDKKTFFELGKLNEFYQMNWSITELTAKVLRNGYVVKAISSPEKYVYHFGQKSRPKKSHRFNQMSLEEVFNIFGNRKVELLKI